MVLEHGTAKIVAVYDESGNLINSSNYTHEGESDGVGKDGFGWVNIIPGSKVVFEFVPEYGYQLTSVKANGQALAPQDTINQYTFTMPDANFHFSAEFTKIDDAVKTNSKNISEGSISLGTILDGGSARLTVNDVELSSDKITGFENAARDYTISNYLDIDLYQVFYKGKEDSDNVWKNKIDTLDNEATISIVLEEGIDANEIVIVHNVHDGDKYEIIKPIKGPNK